MIQFQFWAGCSEMLNMYVTTLSCHLKIP